MHQPKKPALRLPEKLAYTAFHVAIAGTLACSSTSHDGLTGDAAADAPAESSIHDSGADDATADASDDMMALDSPADGDDGAADAACAPDGAGATMFCGPAAPDASCPGFVCDLSQCPLDAGCEPFV